MKIFRTLFSLTLCIAVVSFAFGCTSPNANSAETVAHSFLKAFYGPPPASFHDASRVKNMEEALDKVKPYVTQPFFERLESNLAPFEMAQLLANLGVNDVTPAIELAGRKTPQDRPEYDCRISISFRDEKGLAQEVIFDGIPALEESEGG